MAFTHWPSHCQQSINLMKLLQDSIKAYSAYHVGHSISPPNSHTKALAILPSHYEMLTSDVLVNNLEMC